MKRSQTVEDYILSSGIWQKSLFLLRELLLSTQLDETVKWGCPVYVKGSKNIVGMAAFKSYVGIWFFQGALLKTRKISL